MRTARRRNMSDPFDGVVGRNPRGPLLANLPPRTDIPSARARPDATHHPSQHIVVTDRTEKPTVRPDRGVVTFDPPPPGIGRVSRGEPFDADRARHPVAVARQARHDDAPEEGRRAIPNKEQVSLAQGRLHGRARDADHGQASAAM
ncbi:hypothetical protein BN13_140046 [Nostocoides jenkinsii Ben 74]|uniref:Uncharacterized protein n=1 Tax=Nostocoides jenkinsii Ben 74 TaxID=1193518 RepID=A0A077M659_9MICO|nr:hypothetical protein BN13_140046 [Tetrasphaera jenkinsii Ben 74]